ncbi:MAG TPA: MFS transporter [Thermoflexales bacterium]|nr:MFS transporter [Thermoflexales bacterium]HQW34149.1 MFS transporter [Thermoflexales bacterium]HQZ21905.1 MFS transporter [Thermoflexales bacterium]HQZ98755.1 MFS transporter [Thermoflexales bacterium]
MPLQAPPPSQKFHGWTLAWALGLTQMVSWGVMYYGFGVMLPRMTAEMGWSSAETTLAFSIATIVSAVVAIPFGRWLDRRGPRASMTFGSIAATALLVAWSQAQTLPALYAIFCGMGIAMAATLYEPAFWVVAQFFSGERARQRGKALTIVTFWGGLASTAFVPLGNALAQSLGWRAALLMLALILAVTTIPPHFWFLRHQPEHLRGGKAIRQNAGALKQARAGRAFWLITLAFALTNLATGVTGVHLIAYELSRGQAAAVAAAAAGAVGVMQVVGRLTFAPLSDRVRRNLITASMCVLMALGLAALVVLADLPSLAVYAILFGLGHGALTPMRAALIADTFGIQSYGEINGAVSLAATFARGLSPVGAGLLVASTGSYTSVWWLLVMACALATFSLFGVQATNHE